MLKISKKNPEDGNNLQFFTSIKWYFVKHVQIDNFLLSSTLESNNKKTTNRSNGFQKNVKFENVSKTNSDEGPNLKLSLWSF